MNASVIRSGHQLLATSLCFFVVCTLVGCGGAGEQQAADEIKALGAPLVVRGIDKHAVSLVMMKDAEKIKEAAPLLPNLKYLTSFDAANTEISDEDLVYVGKLKSLTNLSLAGTEISDAGVSHLTGLRNLSSMTLFNTKITSACLPDIGRLKKLGVLTLAENDLQGGYDALASCESLEWIVLSGIELSDQDIDDLLKIPKLGRISITAGTVSEAGLGKLKSKAIALDIESPKPPTSEESTAESE